jgi:hypothetical protein
MQVRIVLLAPRRPHKEFKVNFIQEAIRVFLHYLVKLDLEIAKRALSLVEIH